MAALIDLSPAAQELRSRGWVQNAMEDGEGRVCLTGALKVCDMQPGDWLLARAVLRREGRDERWNDTAGRTEGEVLAVLDGRHVTDADLEATFGPQWEAIVRLVRRAATLTENEADRLRAARVAAWVAARVAARDAAGAAAWGAARDAAGDAAGAAAWDAAGAAAWAAARDAAAALVVADLVGQHGLTQEHVDLLLGPWIEVCGDPREVR